MPRMAWESAGDADEMHIPRPPRLRMTPNVQGRESDFGSEGPRGRRPDLKAWALGIVRPTCRGRVHHLALLSAGTYKAKFTFLSADVQSQVRPPVPWQKGGCGLRAPWGSLCGQAFAERLRL